MGSGAGRDEARLVFLRSALVPGDFLDRQASRIERAIHLLSYGSAWFTRCDGGQGVCGAKQGVWAAGGRLRYWWQWRGERELGKKDGWVGRVGGVGGVRWGGGWYKRGPRGSVLKSC